MTEWIGFPLSSIGLLVLAGVLIGHLLWYRDRSADNERLRFLETRYFQARGAARQRKQAFLKLQQACQSQHRELQRIGEQQAILAADRQQAAELHAAESRRSEHLVAQLRDVLQAKLALEGERSDQAEAIAGLQHQHGELEAQNESLHAKLAALTQAAASSQETIEHMNMANRKLGGTVAQLQQTNEHLENRLEELRHSRRQVEEALQEARQQLADRTQELTEQTIKNREVQSPRAGIANRSGDPSRDTGRRAA
jgi:chromosome segregation ATPase